MRYRFRLAGAVIVVLLSTVAGLAVAAPASAAGTVLTLQNAGSGLCAEALGNHNGAPVVQKPCNNSAAQTWVRINLGDGFGLLQNLASVINYPYAPQCLDVTDGRDINRTPLQVWGCVNTPGMNWRLAATSNGYYKVDSKIGTRCMDVPAGSLESGVRLQIYTCTRGSRNYAQLWIIP